MSMDDRIKLIRKRNNLTQVQLADKLDLKQSTIGRYENNSITPSFLVLMRISKRFGVDIGWLFTGKKEKEEEQTSDTVKYKCPDIVKKAVADLQGSKLEKLSIQHKKTVDSVRQRAKIVNEVRELRQLAQELVDRIIVLQEEIKKG